MLSDWDHIPAAGSDRREARFLPLFRAGGARFLSTSRVVRFYNINPILQGSVALGTGL